MRPPLRVSGLDRDAHARGFRGHAFNSPTSRDSCTDWEQAICDPIIISAGSVEST